VVGEPYKEVHHFLQDLNGTVQRVKGDGCCVSFDDATMTENGLVVAVRNRLRGVHNRIQSRP
jgi:hypothetical protein